MTSRMTNQRNIIFDIGNVLVKWDPVEAFLDDLGSREAVAAFMDRTGFHALNLRADQGETFTDLAQTLADPEDRALIAGYVGNFGLTIRETIPATWAILDRLRADGHAIHAITNWSAETWPIGLATHPRLANAFGVTVVSGQEGLLKPDARIFGLLCERANADPATCLFIDDSEKNVIGARAAGIDAIHFTGHFTGPAALEQALTDRGLL